MVKYTRTPLTSGERDALRRHHQANPELSIEQLSDWVAGQFDHRCAVSTVGSILRSPMENSANPTSTRRQLGKNHEMEAELVAGIKAAAAEAGLSIKVLSERDVELLDDNVLWQHPTNRILQCTRVDPPTLSLAWVGRFKSRHGLRKDQLQAAAAARRNTVSFTDDDESPPRKKPAPSLSRKQFTSADDLLLLQEAMRAQPWGFEQEMSGWLQVAENLNGNELLNLAVTSKSCQSRVQFMVTHLKAGDMRALINNGTGPELVEKLELLDAVALQLDRHSPTPASQTDLDGLRVEFESRFELLNREFGSQLQQLGHENLRLRSELLVTQRGEQVETQMGELLETLRGELQTLRGEQVEAQSGEHCSELLETMRGELQTMRGELQTLRGGQVEAQSGEHCSELLETMRGELQTMRGEQVEAQSGEHCSELLETMRGELQTMRGELQTMRGELQTLRGEQVEAQSGEHCSELLETMRGELQTLRGEQVEAQSGEHCSELLETMRGELQTMRGELQTLRGKETMKRLEFDQQRTLQG